MAGRLIMREPPQLIAPYIMIGMNGWLNAGDISKDMLGNQASIFKNSTN